MKKDRKQLFKRRRYGYGWIPVSLAGWLIVGIYLFLVIFGAFWFLNDVPDNTLTSEVLWYLGLVFIGAGILIYLSAYFGPKPRWRWGKKPDDDPEDDF